MVMHSLISSRIRTCVSMPWCRLEKAKNLGGGRFKWGVGKVIARSPNKPIVIPIFHTGECYVERERGEAHSLVAVVVLMACLCTMAHPYLYIYT